jgi:hypothetical protein
MGSLSFDLYYWCKKKKKSATIEKIRRYCDEHKCPFLGARPRKNSHKKQKRKKRLNNF